VVRRASGRGELRVSRGRVHVALVAKRRERARTGGDEGGTQPDIVWLGGGLVPVGLDCPQVGS
jgi:hypothetical protein